MKTLPALLLFLLAPFIHAASPSDQPFLELLEQRCADCHHDDEKPELSKATVLPSLRADDKYIVSGDAEKSPLYQRLIKHEGDKERMPKNTKKNPLAPLDADELALVRQWIKGPVTAARRFITEEDHARIISADLAQQKGVLGKKGQVRYLSLANLYNERDDSGVPMHSDEQMQAFRVGVNKLLNSLSWKPEIVLATAVDEAGTLLRFNLDAYGMNPEIWKSVAEAYPYQIKRTGSALDAAQKTLGVLPVMRADFFVFVCAQPPVYHTALRIPGETGNLDADLDLEKNRLGFNADHALQHPDALRAGFLKSSVSQGNRLIERLPLPDGGYYWRSYDFDPNRQNRRGGDIFKAPLGPVKSGLTKDADLAFSHDGGELIFSLPNGLQGYMLVDSKGARLPKAPINVVTDSKRQDSRIFNGISCMNCHAEGMITGIKDEVRSHAASLNLAKEDRATIERLFDSTKLAKFFKQDSDRFMAAQAKCGHLGGPEPVGQLYYKFRGTLRANQLAAEIGIDDPALLKALARSDDAKVKNLVASFQSGKSVSRPDFENAFAALISALDLGVVPPTNIIAYVEFGADSQRGGIPTEPGLTVINPDKERKIIKIGDEVSEPATETAEPPGSTGLRVRTAPAMLPAGTIPRVRIGMDDKPTPAGTPASTPPTTPSAPSPAAVPIPGRKIIKLPDYDDKPEPALPTIKPAPSPPVAEPPRKPVKLE